MPSKWRELCVCVRCFHLAISWSAVLTPPPSRRPGGRIPGAQSPPASGNHHLRLYLPGGRRQLTACSLITSAPRAAAGGRPRRSAVALLLRSDAAWQTATRGATATCCMLGDTGARRPPRQLLVIGVATSGTGVVQTSWPIPGFWIWEEVVLPSLWLCQPAVDVFLSFLSSMSKEQVWTAR